MSAFTVEKVVTRVSDTNVYAANDVIGPATGATAAFELPIVRGAMGIRIRSSLLVVQSSAVISGETSYNLHLYSEAPASVFGDNVAWDLASADWGTFIGTIALGTPADIGSSLVIATDSLDRFVYSKTGSLWAYLVTVGTYTPASGRVYRVRLSGELFPTLSNEVLD